MLLKMKTCLASLALLSLAPIAQAQTTMNRDVTGYVGGSIGYADPTAINGRLGYGGDAGMMFSNGMIGSLYYRASDDKETHRSVQVQHYGVGFDWSLARFISGPLGGFRAGVRAGVSVMDKDRLNSTVAPIYDTEFAFGPTLGYDLFHLPGNISIGAEANLMFTQGPAQFSTLYVLANAKYWF